jgi:hypothetical protein
MPSTYSPDLRIELIGTGDQAGVWGGTTNNNLSEVLETAIAGYTSVSVIASSQALTANFGAADQARYAAIALTTTTGANFAVYAPPSSKLYVIYNASPSYSATIANWTTASLPTLVALGTTVTIPPLKTMTIWSDGANFTQQNTHLISPTIASPTLTAPALGTPASGTMTNVTGLPLTSAVTGILPVGNGGTGVTGSTGSGNNVLSTSPTLVTPLLGTPTSGNLSNCTGVSLTSGISGTLPVANGGTGVTTATGSGNVVLSSSPTLGTPILGTPQSVTLTNATGLPLTSAVTGTLPVANGGTGNTTAQAEMNRVAAAVTSGQYLRGNGTNVVMSAIQVADVPTLNQNTTGNAATATNVAYSGLTGAVPTWNQNTTGTAAGLSATLAVASGGTGVTTSTGTGSTVLSASPALTGAPTAPTAAAGTSNTQIATTAFLATMYPVGSIYSSTVATNPATLFGFGTWVAFAAGQVMIGNGGGFSAGTTGGSADAIVVSHTHSITDPGHNHTYVAPLNYLAPGIISLADRYPDQTGTTSTSTTGITVNSTGSSGTNANLQPYIVVYIWNRTA